MEQAEQYKTVNLEALAYDLLRWAAMRREMDDLEAAIADTVLQVGETVVVGYARATYYNPRKSHNYEESAKLAAVPEERPGLVEQHSKVKVTVDWKAVCEEAGIEALYTEAPPCVSLKLDGAPPRGKADPFYLDEGAF